MFFYGDPIGNALDISSERTARASADLSNESKIKTLEDRVERLCLLNQALWELLRERLHLTDADLAAMAQTVDLRDGIADGKISSAAVRCPSCQRVCNSRHAQCLYCGQLFEKPLFG